MRRIDHAKFYIYPDRNSFRVVGIDGGGRVSKTFATREAAQAFVADKRAKTETRSVSDAIAAYLDEKRALGRRETTVDTIEYRLRTLLRVEDGIVALRSITAATGRALWKRFADEYSGDYQKGAKSEAVRFFAFCRAKGWTGADPFAESKATKPRRTGRPQLRIDETRKLEAAALADAHPSGLATAMLINMGIRVSMLTERVVRDVDDGGRILWVDRAKTKNSEGAFEVPAHLRKRLAEYAAQCELELAEVGIEEEIESVSAKFSLWPGDRHWLAYHVKRLCKAAGVPVVTPHGLRGTFTSIGSATRGVEDVARALGHSSAAVTRRHYVAPGVERAAKQRAMLSVMQGGKR